MRVFFFHFFFFSYFFFFVLQIYSCFRIRSPVGGTSVGLSRDRHLYRERDEKQTNKQTCEKMWKQRCATSEKQSNKTNKDVNKMWNKMWKTKHQLFAARRAVRRSRRQRNAAAAKCKQTKRRPNHAHSDNQYLIVWFGWVKLEYISIITCNCVLNTMCSIKTQSWFELENNCDLN